MREIESRRYCRVFLYAVFFGGTFVLLIGTSAPVLAGSNISVKKTVTNAPETAMKRPATKDAAETLETRKNKNGKTVEWIYRRQGVVYKREYDRNGDGKPDYRVLEDHGRLVKKEFDNNFDGKADKIEKPLPRGSSGRIKTMNTENAISG